MAQSTPVWVQLSNLTSLGGTTPFGITQHHRNHRQHSLILKKHLQKNYIVIQPRVARLIPWLIVGAVGSLKSLLNRTVCNLLINNSRLVWDRWQAPDDLHLEKFCANDIVDAVLLKVQYHHIADGWQASENLHIFFSAANAKYQIKTQIEIGLTLEMKVLTSNPRHIQRNVLSRE